MKSLRAFGIGIFITGAAFTIYDFTAGPQQTKGSSDVVAKQQLAKLEEKNTALESKVVTLEKKIEQQQAKIKKGNAVQEDREDTTKKHVATPKATAAKDYALTITSGMGTTEITTQLQQAGVIDNAREFELYIVAKKKATSIQNGTFAIKKGMSYEDILNKMTK